MSTVIAYIDGFNLYYNAVKGTPFKWLDLERLVRQIRNNDHIVRVKYFTAPSVGQRSRRDQETYLAALATRPLVEVFSGKHKQKTRLCLVQGCDYQGDRHFASLEEKRTDVSIAVEMLDDAFLDCCETLVLVSGDSDLVPAIQKIRLRFPEKQVVVYVPNRAEESGHHEIREAAHKSRDLPCNVLRHAQFPDRIPDDQGGFIERPPSW